MSIWNSIDSLRHLSLVLMWAAALLAVAAAGVTWLRYYVDRRVSELSSQAQRLGEEEGRRRQEAAEGELRDLRAEEQESRKRHELAEEELASLRVKSAPRSLSSDEKKAMSAFLTSKPKGSVVIKDSVNASDARGYADEIAAVLTHAGWTVKIDNAIFAGRDTVGVWVTVKDPKKAPPAAGLLQNALKAAGIDARGQYDAGMGTADDEFWLSIGNR